MRSVVVLIIGFLLAGTKVSANVPDWSVNASDFEHTMSVTAVLIVDSEELASTQDIVGAFVNGETRGVANLTYISQLDKYLAFLTIHSNTFNEVVTFKMYDQSNDVVIDAINMLNFSIDAIIGNASQPYAITNTALNNGAEFLTFGFSEVTAEQVVISSNEIQIVLSSGTDITSLTPVFTVSEGAEVVRNNLVRTSGSETLDFSNPIDYRVISEDRTNLNDYTITVTISSVSSTILTTIVSDNGEFVNTLQVPISIMFDEDVDQLVEDDVELTNATFLTLNKADDSNYDLTIIPHAVNQSFTVKIKAGVVTSLASSSVNSESNILNLSFDNVVPIINSVVLNTPTTINTNSSSLLFNITFNKAVNEVSIEDFELNVDVNHTISNVTKIDDENYMISVTLDEAVDKNNIGILLKNTNNITDNLYIRKH